MLVIVAAAHANDRMSEDIQTVIARLRTGYTEKISTRSVVVAIARAAMLTACSSAAT